MQTVQPYTDIIAEHGEGPVWDPVSQDLYWVDIMQGRYFRSNYSTGEVETHDIGMPLGVLALRSNGGIIMGVENGFASYDPANQKLTEVYSFNDNVEKSVRMNDGAVDPAGRFFAGTMDYEETRKIGKLYRLNGDHSCQVLDQGLCITNGMGWSLDHKSFFMIDTPTHTIFKFDYDLTTGNISNKRAFKVFRSDEFPDGMTIDAEGGFWVAMWGGFGVVHLDQTGKMIEKIPVPTPHVTSCCFGGLDLKSLFITTSRIAMSPKDLESYPEAGSLFSITLETKGRQEPRFQG